MRAGNRSDETQSDAHGLIASRLSATSSPANLQVQSHTGLRSAQCGRRAECSWSSFQPPISLLVLSGQGRGRLL